MGDAADMALRAERFGEQADDAAIEAADREAIEKNMPRLYVSSKAMYCNVTTELLPEIVKELGLHAETEAGLLKWFEHANWGDCVHIKDLVIVLMPPTATVQNEINLRAIPDAIRRVHSSRPPVVDRFGGKRP